MKFSKTAVLILIVGIILIACGSLYWLYLQEQGKQQELNEVLSKTQSVVPGLASERTKLEGTLTELEDKLAQAQSELKTAETIFPNDVESIEVDELLFKLANDWDLEIANLIATEPADNEVRPETEDTKVEGVTYMVTNFTVEVKGDVGDILDYINTIVNNKDFHTATVEFVDILIPEPLTEKDKEGLTDEEIAKEEMPSATINLIIYTYEGE
jgi:hypothetical protein